MGELIGPSAPIEDIEADIRTSKNNAMARGGEIAAAATTRLGPAVDRIDISKTTAKSGSEAVAGGMTTLMARDGESDLTLGVVRDALHNFLKRPQTHPLIDEIFPGGLKTYTDGDPRKQHILMAVLQGRIGAAANLPSDVREGWIAQVETVREPQATASKVVDLAEAAETVTDAAYKSTVRSGLFHLRAFKRDLKSPPLNLTEKQIHEIIPDRSKPGGGGKGGKGGEDKGGGGDKGK